MAKLETVGKKKNNSTSEYKTLSKILQNNLCFWHKI